jgi:hypothetical protein
MNSLADHYNPTTLRSHQPFLRRVLIADAAASAAMGAAMLLGGTYLEGLLGLPRALLAYAGLGLLPFAALVAYLATRETLPRAAVWAVIAVNAIWVIDSLVILVTGWVAPSSLGYAFVIAQAAAVAAFAELEYLGLRKPAAG